MPWISEPPRPPVIQPRWAEISLWISRGATVLMVVSTVFEAAIAPGASIAQTVAFLITVGSIVVGIAAGLVASVAMRKRGVFWASLNLVLGLACVALELFDALDNMES